MLVVLASRHDRSADEFVARSDGRATVLTCEDLSTRGWRFDPSDPGAGAAVVGGRVVRASSIGGVLTRRSSVIEAELVHIAPEDRPYVAAEMNAFLLAWLAGMASMGCRVVNRPTTTSLAGPPWRREQWVQAAARSGIPAVPSRRAVCADGAGGPGPDEPGDGEVLSVTVVGGGWFGAADRVVGERALALARLADAELLEAWFEQAGPEAKFLTAQPLPSLESPKVADAVLELLSGEAPMGAAGRHA